MTALVRYRSLVADSARWEGFELRTGDIVISTPPKCGTTWTQMLCALLIFDGPRFPAPLDELSPWLDMCNQPLDDVRAKLAAQTHRRFIKTHTPLDGEHHLANMDFDHFLGLRARVMGTDSLEEFAQPAQSDDPAERFRAFMRSEPSAGLRGLAAIVHHLATAWERRDQRNVFLLHYADMTADLVGEFLRLATALAIPLGRTHAGELAAEAGLDSMRARATELAPASSQQNWKDVRAFFRRGGFGEWRTWIGEEDAAEYERRVAALAPPDLGAWMHLGRLASGIDLDAPAG